MQRRTILALLVPCAFVSAVAFADPAPTGTDAPAPDGPPPTPAPAPAQESPPVPGWDHPSPDEPTPRPAPWTQVPTDLPPSDARPPEPPTEAPTEAPTALPSEAPGTAVPTDVPPTDAPPIDAPPVEAPGDEPGAPILEPPALPEAGAEAAFALYATRPPVAGALYLQGFDVAWEARPHRLKSVIVVADAGAQSADTAPTGALFAQVQGGSWASGARATDTSTVNVAYGGIGSASAQIHRGAVRTTLKGDAPVLGRAEAARIVVPVEVPLGGTGDGAAVYLQGLAIQTDASHPDGFTPHVLEVRLGPATVTDGVARFDITIEVQAAAVPDRDQHLASYGADVEVGWLLVPAAADRVHRVSASATAAHGIEIGARPAHAEPVPLSLGVDLRPGTTDVAAGLSGFRLAVDATGLDAGRYIRSVGVLLEETGVDPWRGRWDGEVEARFSNAGPVTRAEGVTLEADVTVLELVEGERAWSGRWTTTLSGEPQQLAYPGPERMGRR